jgi:hypothetical protein
VTARAANQSSKAETGWEFLVLGCKFKNLPNREIHEIREKEMKKTLFACRQRQNRNNSKVS